MQPNERCVFCCAAVPSVFSASAMAADVVIGVPNRPSVQATAHVLKAALESRLRLEVELKDGLNKEVFDAMNAGSIHVHPEAWLSNLAHLQRRVGLKNRAPAWPGYRVP